MELCYRLFRVVHVKDLDAYVAACALVYFEIARPRANKKHSGCDVQASDDVPVIAIGGVRQKLQAERSAARNFMIARSTSSGICPTCDVNTIRDRRVGGHGQQTMLLGEPGPMLHSDSSHSIVAAVPGPVPGTE